MESYINIYVLDKNTLDQLGVVSEYKGLIFPKAYIGQAKFELYTPITQNNSSLLKEERLIYLDEEHCGEITSINTIINDSGEKVLKIGGITLERLLRDRILWETYIAKDKRPDTILTEIVAQNCITPVDTKRIIPYLEGCDIDENISLSKISHQKTGGEVYEECKTLCETYGFGFGINIDLENKKFKLILRYGLDKTINQTERDYVLLSTDMQDILSSEYKKDVEDVKTTALVAGENSGEERLTVVSGDNSLEGFSRKEMYVDARDIQSKDTELDVTTLLNSRGIEKLSEQIASESFKFTIRPQNTTYKYGVDYFLGDTITVYDEEIGVQANVVVTEIEHEWDGNKFSLTHTFGFKSLKLMDKIKRLIK